ncbi:MULTISPECIES: aminotransferase class I/II-fold pyridoxal phosphate-dependent enzyme [Pseudofrankia]|uniref:aminotransferase class I/II-fold pyridoxal phosphate-dependent enzyme n=1 Tax=Pseudofrankia TaxID=2994363 RepID=UPI000234D077|nr:MULTISPECIES: aminotransferase class I/II-fold pyridoxal phosphate-dependent enzyme [Pseudofrankia]OHV31538.1 hypothetical protein BCD49_31400 [Pseudofrankia sp. EUN1h]
MSVSERSEVLARVEETFKRGIPLGLMRAVATDEVSDGRTVTVDGRPLVNVGSCSYLGLETHPVLTEAVASGARRFGTQFASSRGYLSAPLYPAAEAALEDLFGRPTALFTSTTLGHLATIPTLVGPDDVLLLDAQVHETVRLAAVHARVNGTTVETVPHNSVRVVDRRVRELGPGTSRIWYAADGLYSMYGDLAPAEALSELVERHDRLWLYVDDAHSISWTGRHGRGHALERLSPAALERTVVTGSLNKSFAATGGAITFPDAASRDLVAGLSAPSMFCGPVQPPMLAAVIASAELHRSAEVAERQSLLLARIRLFNELALARDLPLLTTDETPLRYVGTGPDVVWSLAVRLRDAGFFVNVAVYPAVPSAREGLRLTLTLHQTEADVENLVDAIADQLPLALADQGRTPADLHRLRRRVRGT